MLLATNVLDLASRRSRPAAPLLAGLLLTGCGGAETLGSSPRGSAAPAVSPLPRDPAPRTTVYFLTDNGTAPLGQRRELSRRPNVTTARLALEELVAGPTAAERRHGLTTAIPAETKIRSLRIERRAQGSEAFVNLSGLPSPDETAAPRKVRVMTQVARTLIGLNDIERVRLRVDGRAWGLWDLEGNILDDAIDYDRLRGFFQICAAKRGTEAVPGDCFTALP